MERCTLVTAAAPAVFVGAFVSAFVSLGGCVDINGGAVELSWSFQTFQGGSINDECEDTQVESVRLCWRPRDGTNDCTTPGFFADFSCNEFRGITAFTIGAGEQLLEIAPICTGATEPPDRQQYDVPAPILRDVVWGEVVTLDSLLIVIDEIDEESTDQSCACCDPVAMPAAPTAAPRHAEPGLAPTGAGS